MNENQYLRMCAGPGKVGQLLVGSTDTSLALLWTPPCPRLAPKNFYSIQLELGNCNILGTDNCNEEWKTMVGFKCNSSLLICLLSITG